MYRSLVRPLVRHQTFVRPLSAGRTLLRPPTIQHHARSYASASPLGGTNVPFIFAVAALGAISGYYFLGPVKQTPDQVDYRAVYKDIADLLESNPDYDDGSYGPVFLRLAWHAAGTFDKTDGTGGSDGATMRFAPESQHGANAGLKVARDVLEKVKKKHPGISYSDLWSLAGVVAVQEMGGPQVPWRPGRTDKASSADCPPDGRLPDATKRSEHVRDVFYRMGFNDQEIVALIGAHALGRCHTDRSGFVGPWTFSPVTFSNEFFKLMLSERWVEKKWNGPKQYVDQKTGELMMLEADLTLMKDPEFRKWVELYAKDEQRFFRDFAKAFKKLEELGVKEDKFGAEIKFAT